MIVTHDLGEGLLMGDQIALMRDGALVQADPPDRFLARPADDFVAGFIGDDRTLRRLALITASEAAVPGSAQGTVEGAARIRPDLPLREALGAMLASGATRLALAGDGAPRVLTLDAIRDAARDA